ncbi:MAG: DUF4838 domain-containing protein [Kiritimatiellae bacterium]|nr:DUF4838 domain-containing protein [Kiritimatiellia bacterium]
MKRMLMMTLCLGAALCASAGELTLAERGKAPAYTIVYPANASESQKYAAEELQRFLAETTGVTLPVADDKGELPPRAILLGDTRHTSALLKGNADWEKLGLDGFRLKACPPHLLVLGGPVRGALNGCYEILDKYAGCRWYASWYSVIPQRRAVAVPDNLDDTQIPAIAMRETFWYDYRKPGNGDFAARNRANGNSMGLEPKHGGHSFRFGNGLWYCHTFEHLCPPDEFFDKHPEYFSEVNGKRLKHPSQLCLTNPDLLKLVTERVLDHIRKDPTAKYFGVSQNDWHNYCTCPKCKEIDDLEESHAGTMVRFVNAVAEAVEKEFPDKVIETLAYQYTRKPPKITRLRHNVIVCLCSIECDFAFPIDKSAFHQNRKFIDDIEGWSKQTDQLFVWDYTTDFHCYTMPFPNVLALQDNIRFFKKNNVKLLFEQGAYQGRHGDFAELKGWLLSKWMWNPELPAEELMNDFFNGYYGKAAPFVRDYFDALHSFYRDPANKPLTIFLTPQNLNLTDEFLTRAAQLWQLAEEAVKDSPAQLYNVRMGAFPVLFTQLKRSDRFGEAEVFLTANPAALNPPESLRKLAKACKERLDEAQDIWLSESRSAHDAWRQRIEKIAADPKPIPPGTDLSRVTVEEKVIGLCNPGKWGAFVDDPEAEDGKALKLFNSHFEWAAQMSFHKVAFDPGTEFELRARIKVEKEPDLKGEAFWCGIYDQKGKKGIGAIQPKVEEVGDGYAWYSVATWKPERDHYFWMGPGRFTNGKSCIRAVYLDKLEFVRK